MYMRKTKLITLVVIMALIMPLAAWATGQASTGGAVKGDLSWYVYGWNPQEVTVYTAQAEAFMAKNPNINIEVVPVPDGWSAKINTMIASGNPPDVWFGGPNPDSEKTMYDFTDYVNAAKIDYSIYQYPDLAKSALVYPLDGKIYGLPTGGAQFGTLAYSVKLMKDNGLQEPSEPYPRQLTIDDFLSYARKIKKDLDGDGQTDIYGSGYLYYGWIVGGWFPGAQLEQWDENTTWKSPEVLEAFKFIWDGQHKEKYALPFLTENLDQWFVQDKVGFHTDHGGYRWPVFNEAPTFDWDICSLPIDKNYLPRISETSMGVTNAVSKDTKYPDAAWEFIKFQAWDMDFHAQQALLGSPGPLKASVKSFIENTAKPKHIRYHVEATGPVEVPKPGDPTKVVTWDLYGPLWNEQDAFYAGDETAEDFVKRMQVLWKEIIIEGKELAKE
jgi:multiple sugar transport system substrate-binding protein